MFRILFASDFHGSTLVFRKFLNSILTYKANAGIVGGDLTGKALVPIVETHFGIYETSLLGKSRVARSPDELKRLVNDIESIGLYYRVLKKEEYEELRSNAKLQEKVFQEEIIGRMKEWIRLGDDFIKKHRIPIYMIPGNDDSYDIDKLFDDTMIINPNEKVIQINEKNEMVASAYSNMTPWRCPRDIEEDRLEAILEHLMNEVNKPSNAIIVSHVPPYNTQIDLAPALTADLKYVTKGGTLVMEHVGSKAVRNVIERHQPLVGLHGHIHESRGFDKIGRTMVFNPGSEYAEGIFHGVLVVIENDKLKGHILIVG